MIFLKTQWLAWLFLFLPLFARAGGEEVIVVYNSLLPESKMVADHYAAARAVPTNQIFGLPLTTNEVMTRAEFTDSLQLPLAEKLEMAGLWRFAEVSRPATNDQPAHTENRVVASKIRYAVLCYGVPLKIAPNSVMESIAEKITRTEFRRNEAAVDSELAWLPVCRLDMALTGPMPNPFYCITNRAAMHPTNGLLLVARLDGPTAQIANGLVDKALAAERDGFWGRAYVDARGLKTNDTYYLGDQWMMAGAEICRQLGFEVETDTNAETLPASFPVSHPAIYIGWYASDVCGPFARTNFEFMPGAFAYHLYSFSADSLRTPNNHWCGPLLARGATCTMGCVYEPFLQFTPNIAVFLQAFGGGYTFGEAAWASQNVLSWQNTVIGDPLYRPFKKDPALLHAELVRRHNPLLEWSFLRLVNLDLARGVREPELARFLENVPAMATSAVLTEKLASLYDRLGKPASALDAWQRALTLHPAPDQRIRLRLVLAEKLLAQNRAADAVDNYKKLLAESPDYPGRPAIEEKLKALEQKLAAEIKH